MRFSSSAMLLIGFFCLLLTSGCVSKATFEAKVAEVDSLRASFDQLEADYQNLQQQKERQVESNRELSAKLDETLDRNAALQNDLQRARADIERLESILQSRSAESGAAMKEMRQTIDRLEEAKRDLEARLEEERIAREARLAQVQSTYNELVSQMEEEIKRGEITISELQGKLTVNMVDKILFDSGKADLKANGINVLRKVGDVLRTVEDKMIRVEGHTDNVPISPRLKETFPSNWELSAARATNVVRFLQTDVGLAGEKLSAAGFGQYQPVADNDTPEGRAQNRRIQIVLVPPEQPVVQGVPAAAN